VQSETKKKLTMFIVIVKVFGN